MDPTVYIIDDDPSARRGLSRLVSSAGFTAEAFASAADFLASGRTERPGCLILDVRMPEMSGPELQEALCSDTWCLPIIFLSAHGDVPTVAGAMKRGAVDFLAKPVDCDDLLGAVREALARDAAGRIREAGLHDLNGRLESLTPREQQVMTYVISGMLNKQIADELAISEETVKVHRGRVMHKLGVVSVAELVRLCEKAGVEQAGPGAS